MSQKSSTFAPAKRVVVLISLRSNDLLPALQSRAGSSSARLECLLWEQEVVSSNLAYPTSTFAHAEVLFLFTTYIALSHPLLGPYG